MEINKKLDITVVGTGDSTSGRLAPCECSLSLSTSPTTINSTIQQFSNSAIDN
ncbi:hypothetical protein KKG56_09580 [bacterium]|nr:hypothetical protein [bacterium]